MPDAKIKHEPTLLEKRKTARKIVKRTKTAAKVRKLTRAAKRPKSVKKKVAAKKAWLQKPVRVRKIKSTVPGLRRMKVPKAVLPTLAKPSLGVLKGVSPAPVGGVWDGIILIPVISSNVANYGYDPKRAILVIGFLDGSIYTYNDVPEAVWQRFQSASSKGKFVWREVRDVFEYQRVS